MIFRLLFCLALALLWSGCHSPYKKRDEEDRKPLRHMASEPAFQAFVGRLRIAVRKHDLPMIASMMTGDFGYTWEESAQPGAQIFTYWDKNNLWPVLSSLLDKKFAPHDLYMVSPPELALDPKYEGPRCGLRLAAGSWKFAYFLPDSAPPQSAAPPAPTAPPL